MLYDIKCHGMLWLHIKNMSVLWENHLCSWSIENHELCQTLSPCNRAGVLVDFSSELKDFLLVN